MTTPRKPRARRTLLSRLLLIAAVAAPMTLVVSNPASAALAVPPPEQATLVAATTADHTPHARNGQVRAFAEIGDTIYVGGTFNQVRQTVNSPWLSRPFLFAYNRHTGEISTTFLPEVDGAVNALQVSPDGNLIVGGAFRNVNGVPRRNLVALDATTGATVSNWVGRGDGGVVRDMALHGNDLYVGGAFLWVNGTFHSLLARLDATTGEVDPTFQVDASVPRSGSIMVEAVAVSPDGQTLVFGGNFTEVNGLARNQVAMVDLAGTPTVADWRTHRFEPACYDWSFDFYVKDIDFSDDGSYFVIGTTGGRDAGGVGWCDTVSRWETDARGNVDGTWVNFTGTDTVTSVLASDGVIYMGGHFRWVNNSYGNDTGGPGAIDRLGIAALDPSNGLPFAWNAWRSGGGNLPPGAVNWGPEVPVLFRGTDGVYFGQDSDGMSRKYHGRQGLFPLASGRTVTPHNAPETLPGSLYLGTAAGQLTKVPFDGATLGVPQVTSQPELMNPGAIWPVHNRVHWANLNTNEIEFSMFSNGTAGPPWISGWNGWFNASVLRGAFLLDGRLYYVRSGSGSNALHYRYFQTDSGVLGATEFSLPTTNINWSSVRGLTVTPEGNIVYGHTNGSLRSVAFDPTAATGYAVDGSDAVVLATPADGLTWSTPALFYSDR